MTKTADGKTSASEADEFLRKISKLAIYFNSSLGNNFCLSLMNR